MIKKTFTLLAAFLVPSIVSAQTITVGQGGVAGAISEILGYVIPIIFALVLAFFFFNLAKYIFSDKDKEKSGSNMAISFGIIFVMISIAGIVALLQNSVQFDDQNINVPQFQIDGSGNVNNTNS